MYRRRIGTLLLGALIVSITPGPKEVRARARVEKVTADLEFVAQSGCSFIALRPGDLLAAPPIKLLPRHLDAELKRTTASTDQLLGLPIAEIERVTILIVSPLQREPVVVVRTVKDFDAGAVVKKVVEGAESRQHKGRTLFVSKQDQGRALCPLDKRNFVVGRPGEIKTVIDRVDSRETKRPHATAVEWAAENHQIVVGMQNELVIGLMYLTVHERAPAEGFERVEKNETKPAPRPEPVKDKEAEKEAKQVRFVEDRAPAPPPELNLADALAELPPAVLPFKPLLLAKTTTLAIDLGAESKARLQMTYVDAEAAEDGATAMRSTLYVLREALAMLPSELRATPDETKQLSVALAGFRAALKSAAVERNGTTVSSNVTVKTDETTLGTFFSVAEKAAMRVETENNLRQIALAMHAYHDVNGGLPAQAIVDAKGTPLLSWRVAILPYIEQENLYRQFKFDEPWDSPNNIKLLDKMPKQFSIPLRPTKGKGETFFQVFTGPNTIFDPAVAARPGPNPTGIRIFDITDGTANTMLVVESATAVPWTKPDDLRFDPKKPLPKLGGTVPGRFFAVFADGQFHSLNTKLDAETLRALITRAGGEALGEFDDERPFRRGPRRYPDRAVAPSAEGRSIPAPPPPPLPPPPVPPPPPERKP